MIIETIGEFGRETLELGTETSRYFKSNGELLHIKVGEYEITNRTSGIILSTRS